MTDCGIPQQHSYVAYCEHFPPHHPLLPFSSGHCVSPRACVALGLTCPPAAFWVCPFTLCLFTTQQLPHLASHLRFSIYTLLIISPSGSFLFLLWLGGDGITVHLCVHMTEQTMFYPHTCHHDMGWATGRRVWPEDGTWTMNSCDMLGGRDFQGWLFMPSAAFYLLSLHLSPSL